MSDAILTWGSIIDALGGTGAAAEALDEAASTVSGWRTRPRGIPAEHWSAIVRIAAERGRAEITLEVLAELAARRVEIPAELEARA